MEENADVENFNNDEPYVHDEHYNIRMVGGSGDSPRETPGEGSQGRTTRGPMYPDDEDPTEFLVWMAGRLLTRLNKLTEENDPGRRKFVKYNLQLDILRGVYHDYKTEGAPRHRVAWFVSNMSALSENEDDRPGDLPDVCAITSLEALSEPGGVFRDESVGLVDYEALTEEELNGERRNLLLHGSDSDYDGESSEPETEGIETHGLKKSVALSAGWHLITLKVKIVTWKETEKRQKRR